MKKRTFLIALSWGLLLPMMVPAQTTIEAFLIGSTPSPITDRAKANENGYDVSHERFPIYPGVGFQIQNHRFGASGALLYNPVTFTADFPSDTNATPYSLLSARAKGHYLQLQTLAFLQYSVPQKWAFSFGVGPNIHFLMVSERDYTLQNPNNYPEFDLVFLRNTLVQMTEQVSVKRYFKQRFFAGISFQAMQSFANYADEGEVFPLKKNQFAGNLSIGMILGQGRGTQPSTFDK